MVQIIILSVNNTYVFHFVLVVRVLVLQCELDRRMSVRFFYILHKSLFIIICLYGLLSFTLNVE